MEKPFFVRISQTEIVLPKTLSIVGGWQVFGADLIDVFIWQIATDPMVAKSACTQPI